MRFKLEHDSTRDLEMKGQKVEDLLNGQFQTSYTKAVFH